MSLFNKTNDRKWFACAFVKFQAPELSLSHSKFALLKTKPLSEIQARNEMRNMRKLVKSSGWEF